MSAIDAVGGIAAVLTTLSFLPQAARTIRTGDTNAISLAMYAMFTAGVAFWLVYGVLLSSAPIIIANSVTILMAGLILTLKTRAVRAKGEVIFIRPPME